MLDKWTGEVVGTMHIYGISNRALARRMNVTAQYLSMVLNCKKRPAGIELKTRCALNDLLKEAGEECRA